MLVSSTNIAKQPIVLLLLTLLAGSSASAQTLSLASGSAVKGGSISLNLSLNAGASTPAGLQWTLSYPSSEITSFSMAAGPVLAAAGKSLSCAPGAGTIRCLVTGMNSTAIASGVVAVATATVSSGATASVESIPMTNTMAAFPDGTNLSIAGSGGTISLGQSGTGPTPTAAYSFNEGTGTTITDLSGNGSNGTISNATWTTVGKYSNALSFDGNTSYVDLGNPAALQLTGSMTVSAWIFATGTPADDGQIIAKGGDFDGWQFKTSPDTGVRTFACGVSSGSAITQRYSQTVVGLNTWYHVTGVYDASARTLDIYVNGVLDNGVLRGTIPAAQNNSPVNVYIGKRSGGSYLFQGTIDEVRVYNQALTQAQIQADMNTPLGGSGGAPTITAKSLACSPSTVASGGTSTCTVTISQAAPTGGASVALSDNSAALTVPASVNVAAGASTGSFTATAGTVSSNQTAVVTATLGGTSATASVTITPPPVTVTVTALQCSPSTMQSGGTSTCTATLSQAAPSGGASVAISDNSAALTVPASVTIAAGSTTGSFTATAGTVSANQSVTVTASLNGSSRTASITITPITATVSAVQCTPSTVNSGSSASCTVTLAAAAPSGGSVVSLSSNNAALTVPASVTVAAGSATGSFTAMAGTVNSNQTVTLTASLNGSSATVTMTVKAPGMTTLQCTPSTTQSGATSTCTVMLSQVAPSGGAAVAVSDNSAALTVPASLTIAAGSNTGSFTATAGTVSANQSVIVTASLNGSSATASVTITPLPATVTALQCSPSNMQSGGASTCTATLSQAAPSGGAAVAISDNSAALTVPASVTVAAGSTTGSFTTTAGTVSANQSVTVTASLNGSSRTASITITPALLTVTALQCSPSTMQSGGTSICTATLSQAAPSGGTAVTISDNSAALTVPALVTIAAGWTTGSFTATAGTVSANQSVTVTASLNGSSATATLTVQPSTTTTLAAAFAFDEGTGSITSDLSANHLTGAINGATWSNGKFGKSLSFDGKSNYVDIGNPAVLQSAGSMTWSAWVYVKAHPSDDGQIVARSDQNTGWQFKTSPDTGVRTFAIAVGAGSSHAQRYSRTVLALKTWYYVAGVYNASAQTLDIYVNGVLDNGVLRGTIPSSQVNTAVNATIGKRVGGYYFNGLIDNLRIYDRALSTAEVQGDMNLAITSASTALMSNANTTALLTPGATGSETPVHSFARHGLADLSCSPKIIDAGSEATCALRMAASAETAQLRVTSSSGQLTAPASVRTRPNQTGLSFRVSAEKTARQQRVTVSVSSGEVTLQDTIGVVANPRPILTVPGRQLAKHGKPLAFMVSALDATDLPVQLSAAGIPEGAAFDAATGRFEWTPGVSQTGKFKLAFMATNSAGQSASAEVAVDVSSGVPTLESAERSCSPGAVGSLKGAWLSPADQTVSDATGDSMALGGTRVKVNGRYAPVLLASATNVQFVCPALNAGTRLDISVETEAGITEPLNMEMQGASPWLFPLDGSSQDQGVVLQAGTAELAMVRNAAIDAAPAQPGSEVVIWGTGFSAPDGISVSLGGIDAEVVSVRPVAGHAGVFAIQVRIPMGVAAGDGVPVQVRVTGPDGKPVPSNQVRMAIERI